LIGRGLDDVALILHIDLMVKNCHSRSVLFSSPVGVTKKCVDANSDHTPDRVRSSEAGFMFETMKRKIKRNISTQSRSFMFLRLSE